MVYIQAQTLKSDQKSGIFRLFLILDPGNDPLKCSGIENDCFFFFANFKPCSFIRAKEKHMSPNPIFCQN